IYQRQDRNEQALQAYERSKRLFEELGQQEKVAAVLGDIGGIYLGEGRYELAQKCLQEALKTHRALNARLDIGITLSRLGLIDFYQGRYAQALERYRESLKIREELGNKQGIALVQNRIGLVYDDLGLTSLALENYQKSLRLFGELGDLPNQANVLLNIGSVLSDQGDTQQAMAYFQRSQKVFEEAGLKSDAVKPLHNIGNIYRKEGRYEQALAIFEQCRDAQEAGQDKLALAITLKSIGLTQFAKGRYLEALETNRRALALASEMNNLGELWRIQESLGRTFRALGQVDQARQAFLASIATIEALRGQLTEGAQQQESFLENKLSPWHGMIDLLAAQQRGAEAFSFAERSKARVLLDILQAGRSDPRKSLSPQEQQAEEDHRLRLVSLNSQLTSEARRKKPEPARLTELKAGVEQARLAYEAFETDLYAAHPELKIRRG